MPDHLHLLCEARTVESGLVSFVHDAKQRTGYAFARRTRTRLWQQGFYDRILRDEDDMLAVVRYIVTNPVRAGLARDVGEYPFCGSDLFSMDEICACSELWDPGDRRANPKGSAYTRTKRERAYGRAFRPAGAPTLKGRPTHGRSASARRTGLQACRRANPKGSAYTRTKRERA